MSTAMSHISLVINSITLMITIITRISVTVNYSMLVTISHISLFINSISLMWTTIIPHISVSINSISSTVKILHLFLSMMYHIRGRKIYSTNIKEQNGFHIHLSRVSPLINSITLVLTTIPHISVSINSISSTIKIFHFSPSMTYRIGGRKINSGSIEEQNRLVAIRQEFSRGLFLSFI